MDRAHELDHPAQAMANPHRLPVIRSSSSPPNTTSVSSVVPLATESTSTPVSVPTPAAQATTGTTSIALPPPAHLPPPSASTPPPESTPTPEDSAQTRTTILVPSEPDQLRSPSHSPLATVVGPSSLPTPAQNVGTARESQILQMGQSPRHSPPATVSGSPHAPALVSGTGNVAGSTPALRSEPGHGHVSDNGHRIGSFHRNSVPARRQTTISLERDDDAETLNPLRRGSQIHGNGNPLPPLPHEIRVGRPLLDRTTSVAQRSAIDWVVPVEDKPYREKTAGERIEPTLLTAITEKDKYAWQAKLTGYALNLAIGLQVLLGALTTGLSAATSGRQTSIATAILGGLSTVVASYLARTRGSNEPELSITRVKDLEQFIRECRAFQMDRGHMLGDKCDTEIETLRRRFEELLGNANGERRLAPPV